MGATKEINSISPFDLTKMDPNHHDVEISSIVRQGSTLPDYFTDDLGLYVADCRQGMGGKPSSKQIIETRNNQKPNNTNPDTHTTITICQKTWYPK